MDRKLKSFFPFFFKIILLFQFYFHCGIAAEEIEAKNNFTKLKYCNSECRIEKIENHNQRQEQEIFSLKNIVDEDKKMINLLNDRVSQLEALVVSDNSKNRDKEDSTTRLKRPARLLPAHILYGDKKKSENDTRFYGPPTSCEDMGNLGYTLNGFYIVNGEDEFKKKRVEIVFCRFKLPQGSNDLKEERLGFLTLAIFGSQTPPVSRSPTVLDISTTEASRLVTLKTSSTVLTTQKTPKDCTPLWHLKIGQNSCLEVQKQGNYSRLFVPECNKYSLAQTWEKIQNTAFTFQICKKDMEKCLTVAKELSGSNRAVSLENFMKRSENQLWMINEKKLRFENVYSGLCLINVGMVSFFASGIEARVCPKNSVNKMGWDWSFVPLNNCAY